MNKNDGIVSTTPCQDCPLGKLRITPYELKVLMRYLRGEPQSLREDFANWGRPGESLDEFLAFGGARAAIIEDLFNDEIESR